MRLRLAVMQLDDLIQMVMVLHIETTAYSHVNQPKTLVWCGDGESGIMSKWERASVTFLFPSPYCMQIHWTASFPLSPIHSQGLMYFYDSILLMRSHLTTSCLVRYLSGVAI